MGLFQPCDRFWICSVSCGTTWNRSPTTPKSASSNIGASASLLITMMVLDVCMPARCWMAPEMPTAMYSCGDTVFPVWPTWNWCGYQPASVAARDAPTAAPSVSASFSISAKLSPLPTPRPPETTIEASVSSGRSPRSCTTRSMTRALFATSLAWKLTVSVSAAPGAGSGATAFGRTATIGVPERTLDWTTMAPPKIDCSAIRSSPRSTASVIRPEPVFTASLPAISRPSAVLATSTASGDLSATRPASSSAFGATTYSLSSSPPATYTLAAPNSASRSRPPSAPGPAQTTEGSPNRRARVSSSQVTFLTVSPSCSARTRISAMCSGPSSLGLNAACVNPGSDELLRGEELGRLHAAVAFVLDDRAGLPGRPLGEADHLGGRRSEADLAGLEADVRHAQGLDRLLLRRHDPLERRVAGLVDLLDHAHDRRQAGLDPVVAVVGLPVDGDRGPVHVHLAGERQLRHAEPLGQHRSHHAHPGVGGLRAQDHQVEPDPAEHRGERRRRRERVRPVQRVVKKMDRLVRAHRQRLADRLARLLRAHGQDRHLAAVRLGQAQPLLDRVLVELVDHRVGRVAVQGGVGGPERALRPGVRDLLHADDDVHDRRPTSLCRHAARRQGYAAPAPPSARLSLPNNAGDRSPGCRAGPRAQ